MTRYKALNTIVGEVISGGGRREYELKQAQGTSPYSVKIEHVNNETAVVGFFSTCGAAIYVVERNAKSLFGWKVKL